MMSIISEKFGATKNVTSEASLQVVAEDTDSCRSTGVALNAGLITGRVSWV